MAPSAFRASARAPRGGVLHLVLMLIHLSVLGLVPTMVLEGRGALLVLGLVEMVLEGGGVRGGGGSGAGSVAQGAMVWGGTAGACV